MAELVVSGGRCLLPGRGLVPADIVCADGHIVDIRSPGSTLRAAIDATDCLVLPGIVDIHGDAFERQIMPRPKTMFPLDLATMDTDRQLAANGITTAYHGVTISWEPGLRSLEQSMRVIDSIDRLQPMLLVDNRIHIRWETYALDAAGAVHELLKRNGKPLLAFNDHTSHLMKVADVRGAIARHAERSMVEAGHYLALYEAVAARRDDVPAGIASMAAAANRLGVRMLSHDDRTPGERDVYRSLGVRIAEFPVTVETLDNAVAAGDFTVLGAPNVVRGGSHTGSIGAEAAIREGKCSILASDYYYPAQLGALLDLDERGVLPIEEGWKLVSSTPAAAAGLDDRGLISEGLRADLIIVCRRTARPVTTICGGRTVFRTR